MSDKENSHWETRTWHELKRICETTPEAGIHFQSPSIPLPLVNPHTDLHAENQLHRRNKDLGAGRFADVWIDPNPWFKDVLPGFRHLPLREVLPGHDSASEYGSVCINTAIYLPWLVGQLLRNGVVLKRAVLGHISDAAALSHTGRKASIIVNATGLGSLKLGGVEDTKMAPARGQVVLVRNEADPPGTMLASTGTDDGDKDVLYMMQRAAGGGTALSQPTATSRGEDAA
jgi:D-amino-acid oxidase